MVFQVTVVGLGQTWVNEVTMAVTVLSGMLLTGVVMVHGQSVIVTVLLEVTVHVFVPCEYVPGVGQTVVKLETIAVTVCSPVGAAVVVGAARVVEFQLEPDP